MRALGKRAIWARTSPPTTTVEDGAGGLALLLRELVAGHGVDQLRGEETPAPVDAAREEHPGKGEIVADSGHQPGAAVGERASVGPGAAVVDRLQATVVPFVNRDQPVALGLRYRETVSDMASGSKICSWKNEAAVWPDARAISTPRICEPVL